MEFVIILIISILLIITLGILFDYNRNKMKSLGKNEKLDNIAKKYPSNIEICKYILKKLNNESVKIEENKDTEASLYIAITNKISIANISKSYTRIQTIAHECSHSIQDRKILLFNFAFSNIYLMYFIIICVLGLLKMLPLKMMFLAILLLLSICYYMVRIYLENDAMLKAKYLAKEYMEEQKISTRDEITEMVEEFDKINNIGIKCVNYNFFLNIMIKVIIFTVICIIR